MAIANGLEKPETDIAFMPAQPEDLPGVRRHDDRERPVQPPIQRAEAVAEAIRFECEKCGKRYTVRTSLAGKKARCKECGRHFQIPYESSV
jgi:transcription elongation factor Elf1